MSRSERLLQLLQVLRRYQRPVSGGVLARELGVSIRTLYRDIASLQSQGAGIEGEPGVGYVLRPGFLLPPLTFSQAELEAVMLGMRWVSTFADCSLSAAADDALAKIQDVLPSEARDGMGLVPLRVGPPGPAHLATEDLADLREAVRRQRKLEIVYSRDGAEERARVIWPFAIGYFVDARILVGWCEMRSDYRHFRTDRLVYARMLPVRYPRASAAMFREWRSRQTEGR